MAKPEEATETGRNAPLRESVKPASEAIAHRIHTTFPWMKADHLTIIGTVGVAATAAYAATLIPHDPSLAQRVGVLASYGFFSLFDMLDGTYARYMDSLGIPRNKQKGVLLDVGSDRVQEVVTFLAHMALASAMGNEWGMYAAAAAAAISPLTSWARARAEKRGIFVREDGGNVLGFLGTRTGRAIAGVAGLVAPEIHAFPLQTVADCGVVATTAYTGIQRYFAGNHLENAITDEQLGAMDSDKREKIAFEIAIAPRKEKLMKIALGTSLAATSLAYFALR